MTLYPDSMLLDVHTHHLPPDADTALLNCTLATGNSADTIAARWISLSIHPWQLTPDDLPTQLDWVKRRIASDPRVQALGETGLDKVCHTPLTLQQTAFREMIRLSEVHNLPLILHVVKATAEVLALKKELHPHQPWIVHGFRGKAELAQTYLRHGFYLSFGEYYQAEALRCVPPDRLLIETDESNQTIRSLYARAAETRGIAANALQESIASTLQQLFFKHRKLVM